MTNFVKGRHRDDKKEFIGDQVRCKDIFSVHVEKGQTLESEEAQSEKCYNPVEPDQLKMSLHLT
jgi:hypothetical protein